MARQIGDNTRPVALTADAARRVAKAVQAYEQGRVNIKPPRLRTAYGDDSEPIRLARVDAAWPKDTTAQVTPIYESDCDDEGSGSGSGSGDTIEVWNRLFDIPADALVEVAEAKNGCWYVVGVGCGDAGSGSGSGSGSGDCGCLAIGGQDLTTVEGYSASGTQILGHVDGCLKWIDTTDCGSGSS